MVQQQRKKIRRNSSPGAHHPNWLWGEQSVLETLEAGRWRVYELFAVSEVAELHSDLFQSKQKEGTELAVVSTARLTELVETTEHQGIVARVSKYPYESFENFETSLQANPVASNGLPLKPMVVVIDRVQDTFLFAAILRCCGQTGVTGVIVGKHCQAQVTPQISRASLGAVNHFPIVQSDDLMQAVQKIKGLGFQLVASDPKSEQLLDQARLSGGTALLIGSDLHSLDPLLLELCDRRLSIQKDGRVPSLHSAVAAGIFLYEIRRLQRNSVE